MSDSYVGVINIYKEKGFTSHDVVNIVRKTLGRVKTGHTGTLDPNAEGVLPVCVGKATRLADYLAAETKAYRAEIIFGAETDTEDSTGFLTQAYDFNYDEKKINEAVNSFIGEYEQTPPMYSAIKVKGKKLYELARGGKEIERQKRSVIIYELAVNRHCPPDRAEIEVVCSKGTYVRSLCRDIGKALGSGAHMGALTRTRSGNFLLEDSIKIDEFRSLVEEGRINEKIIPLPVLLSKYRKMFFNDRFMNLLYNGNKLPLENEQAEDPLQLGESVLVLDNSGAIIGLYQVMPDCLKPLTILREV